MDSQMRPGRRALLGLLTSAAASLSWPSHALGRRRPRYGGSSQIFLPCNLSRIDPHDPHDLTVTLLGGALFETLYGRSPTGAIYPTLASGQPTQKNGRTIVELRPRLSFASGRRIDANQVMSSLRRSQAASPALAELGAVETVRGAPLQLSFAVKDPSGLVQLLSHPRAAIIPSDFSPGAPDTCGAFRITRTGAILNLARNPLAPRGGAFLDEVIIHSASVSDCLRAFEARRSDLGFLGAGLHRERQGIARFRLNPVGLALLLPGAQRRAQMPVGSLHEALARLPEGPLSAVGVERKRHAAQRWNGGDAELAVSQEEPWLIAIAEEMRSAWSTKGHALTLRALPSTQLSLLRRSGNFDLMLHFLGSRSIPARETTNHLFQVDGRAPPRGGRTLSPLESGRQLSLGIVGELSPSGATSPRTRGLVDGDRLSLESSEALQ